MNASASITAALDADTIAMVEELPRARGITGAEFAAEAIRRVAESQNDYRAFVQDGIDAADPGEIMSQDDMEIWFEERIAARRRG